MSIPRHRCRRCCCLHHHHRRRRFQLVAACPQTATKNRIKGARDEQPQVYSENALRHEEIGSLQLCHRPARRLSSFRRAREKCAQSTLSAGGAEMVRGKGPEAGPCGKSKNIETMNP